MNRFFKVLIIGIIFLNSCSKEPSSSGKEVFTDLFFIRGNFKPYNNLHPNFDIESRSVAVKNINKANLKPKLSAQGFMFENFANEKKVTNFLDQVKSVYSKNISDDERHRSLKPSLAAFEEHVKTWAAQQGVAVADKVICGRGYYRNTDIAAQVLLGAEMHFEFAHFDFFPNQDLTKLFQQIGFNKQLVEHFGDDANKKDFWQEYKLVTMINLWMPLKDVHAFPLAVLDVKTLSSQDVLPFTTQIRGIEGSFVSGAVRYRSNQQFYFKPEMKKGDVIVFESFKTPHTAFKLTDQTGDRESYDIRCAFISKNS